MFKLPVRTRIPKAAVLSGHHVAVMEIGATGDIGSGRPSSMPGTIDQLIIIIY